MKQLTKSIGVALLISAMSFNAFADGGRYERHRYESHSNGPGWLAPLLFLGVAGAIISSADRAPATGVYVSPPVTYAPVTPIYVTPPVIASAPSPVPNNFWYFCRSVGQYYPYTPSCPEGWQRVSPVPQ
jgi:hypothetical protein